MKKGEKKLRHKNRKQFSEDQLNLVYDDDELIEIRDS